MCWKWKLNLINKSFETNTISSYQGQANLRFFVGQHQLHFMSKIGPIKMSYMGVFEYYISIFAQNLHPYPLNRGCSEQGFKKPEPDCLSIISVPIKGAYKWWRNMWTKPYTKTSTESVQIGTTLDRSVVHIRVGTIWQHLIIQNKHIQYLFWSRF